MAGSAHREFLDPSVLGRLKAIPLCARQPMLGNVSGRHRSPVRGSSLEFSEYRKYVPGDDKRRLDWRAYGRSDRYYVREFEADTNLRLCLVVDTSGSMGFAGNGELPKLDYARRLAAALAYLAVGQGDAVALYSAGASLRREIPAKRNPSHLRKVLDEIGALRAEGETGLVPCLHAVAEKVRQRALVVVISDLFVRPEPLGGALQHLRFRKHDVAVFQLLDPMEIHFDCQRTTRFVDMEGNTTIIADPDVVRREYQRALAAHLEAIDGLVRDSHVDYHRVVTDQAYDRVLSDFLLRRRPKGVRG